MAMISELHTTETPAFWRAVLAGVKLGRGAIAGAGLALALLGALALVENAAMAAMITVPMIAIGAEALNIAAAIGAVAGATFQAVFNR